MVGIPEIWWGLVKLCPETLFCSQVAGGRMVVERRLLLQSRFWMLGSGCGLERLFVYVIGKGNDRQTLDCLETSCRRTLEHIFSLLFLSAGKPILKTKGLRTGIPARNGRFFFFFFSLWSRLLGSLAVLLDLLLSPSSFSLFFDTGSYFFKVAAGDESSLLFI